MFGVLSSVVLVVMDCGHRLQPALYRGGVDRRYTVVVAVAADHVKLGHIGTPSPPPFVLSVLLGATALWLSLRSELFDGPHRGESAAVSLAMGIAATIEMAALDRL